MEKSFVIVECFKLHFKTEEENHESSILTQPLQTLLEEKALVQLVLLPL